MDKSIPSFKAFFWYPLETVEAAKLSRIPALILWVFGAVIWSIIAVGGFFSPSIYGKWSILYAFLFILISLGLLRMRREAAIVGFVVSLVGLVFDMGSSKAVSDALMLLLDGLAIRGTFAYVRLSQNVEKIHSV